MIFFFCVTWFEKRSVSRRFSILFFPTHGQVTLGRTLGWDVRSKSPPQRAHCMILPCIHIVCMLELILAPWKSPLPHFETFSVLYRQSEDEWLEILQVELRLWRWPKTWNNGSHPKCVQQLMSQFLWFGLSCFKHLQFRKIRLQKWGRFYFLRFHGQDQPQSPSGKPNSPRMMRAFSRVSKTSKDFPPGLASRETELIRKRMKDLDREKEFDLHGLLLLWY